MKEEHWIYSMDKDKPEILQSFGVLVGIGPSKMDYNEVNEVLCDNTLN